MELDLWSKGSCCEFGFSGPLNLFAFFPSLLPPPFGIDRFCVLMGLGRTEDKFISNHPEIINFWFIIFECISAFGEFPCLILPSSSLRHPLTGLVGVSLGIPGEPISLSGGYTVWGKMLTILCFYMGKNRAMPKPEDDVIDFDFKMLQIALSFYRTSLRDGMMTPQGGEREGGGELT
jgi:hypothetical protein